MNPQEEKLRLALLVVDAARDMLGDRHLECVFERGLRLALADFDAFDTLPGFGIGGKDAMSDYPEHDKLHLVKDKSQAVGEFLDWLQGEKGISLCRAHEHSDECRNDAGGLACGGCEGEYYTINTSTVVLLGEFFGIDRDRLEVEKCSMLDALRR